MFIILIIGIVLVWNSMTKEETKQTVSDSQAKDKVVVYKSPTCGCCVKYIEYLEKEGFEVETVETDNMALIKKQYQISGRMESCHTAIFDNYFVEGHVPLEAVNKLLTERPEVDGISLPGMPAGSPGMPGIKQGEFKIFKLLNGQTEPFISL